jgi:N4-gp56 family major capsid protein
MDAVATQPVREAYWAVTSPAVHFTLNSLPGWIPVANYANQDGVLPGEVGSFEDIRFLVSTKSKKYTGATDSGATATAGQDIQTDGTYSDVHTITIFGQDAFGIVPLDGNSFENIIHPSDSGGPGNPLNQFGTMAWKRNGTQVILDDNFMTRIEVAVGNNAP